MFLKKLFRKFRTHLLSELIEEQKKEFDIQRMELDEIKSNLSLLTYMISCQNKGKEETYLQNSIIGFKHTNWQNNLLIQQRMKQIIDFTKSHIVRFSFYDKAYKNAFRILDSLSPTNVLGKEKIRFGDNNDGGYVSIEPEIKKNNDGIAYSFGISTSDPWSMEMVKRGYNVFQYDGTIENSPDNHPMIHFNKFMITGSSKPKQNEKNFKQILEDHGHQGKNIILNIDIEGSEWDFFDSLTKEEILQFEQIIVEFHGFYPEEDEITKRIKILEKINKTHQCIHLHGNNCAPITILKELRLLPAVMEVSYIRKDPKYKFIECVDAFPGNLDTPNTPFLPDIYIGVFNGKKS